MRKPILMFITLLIASLVVAPAHAGEGAEGSDYHGGEGKTTTKIRVRNGVAGGIGGAGAVVGPGGSVTSEDAHDDDGDDHGEAEDADHEADGSGEHGEEGEALDDHAEAAGPAGPDAATWVMIALLAAGFVWLYRKLPSGSS